MNNAQDIIDFENGVLSMEDTAEMFQRMIDSGTVWQLHSAWGRQARDLIDSGWCVLSDHETRDYYGNGIPSRHQLQEGAPGTLAYAQNLNPDFVLYAQGTH